LSTIDTTTNRSSNSGLEVTPDGLRLLGGCSNNEVLSWDNTSNVWKCSTPSSLSGLISGSGSEGQIAFFTGANTQSGSNNLFWDISNSRLGIGTTSPSRILEVAGEGLIGGVILGSENIGIVSKTDLINLLSSGVTINGSLTTTGPITSPSSINTINGIVISNGSITSGSWLGSVVDVTHGGTGTSNLSQYGVLVGEGSGAIQSIVSGSQGQILVGMQNANPIFAALTGDISSVSVSGTSASVSLSNTGVTPSTYGSSTSIPQFTVDSKGRITSATGINISSSLLPIGTEGQMLYNNAGTWTSFQVCIGMMSHQDWVLEI